MIERIWFNAFVCSGHERKIEDIKELLIVPGSIPFRKIFCHHTEEGKADRGLELIRVAVSTSLIPFEAIWLGPEELWHRGLKFHRGLQNL